MLHKPLKLALHNDYQVIAHGLKTMLAPFQDRMVLVEAATKMPVEGPVDLTLFDTFGNVGSEAKDIDEGLSSEAAGRVVVYSWNMHPQLVNDALSRGCRGYLSKELDGKELVEVPERIAAGEVVVSPEAKNLENENFTGENTKVTWPGKDAGLSPRESEMIVQIVQGLTNQDIAERSDLSINTVRSYIRTAYNKMNVNRRAQAVPGAWKTACYRPKTGSDSTKHRPSSEQVDLMAGPHMPTR